MEELEATGKCAICKCKILENPVSCSVCSTRHHKECWEANGKVCSVFGCDGGTVVPSNPSPPVGMNAPERSSGASYNSRSASSMSNLQACATGLVFLFLPFITTTVIFLTYPANQSAKQSPAAVYTIETIESHIETYTIDVNYDLAIDEEIETGNFPVLDEEIHVLASELNRMAGKKKLVAKLVKFDSGYWGLSSNNILERLRGLKLRPGRLDELLAFAKKYNRIYDRFPIVALDTLRGNSGSPKVIFLDRVCSSLTIPTLKISNRNNVNWSGEYRFLAFDN